MSVGRTDIFHHRQRPDGRHTYHHVKVGFQIRIVGTLDLGTLDAFPHHALGQVFPMTQKVFVIIARSVETSRNARKAVEIQLPLKGGQLVEIKISFIDREGNE